MSGTSWMDRYVEARNANVEMDVKHWATIASMPEETVAALKLSGEKRRKMISFLRLVRIRLLWIALYELKDPVNRFFDEVYVMDKDPEQRAANLGLMQVIADLPAGLVDFTKLQGF